MSLFVLLSTLLFPKSSESFETSNNVPTPEWDYNEDGNNVSHWVETWPECGGTHQSPINLNTSEDDTCTTPFTLQYSCDKEQHFAIRNNGKSIQAIPLELSHAGGSEISGIEVMHHTNDTSIRLQNAFFNTYASNINAEYCFDSLHFHWGETNEYGSEHTLNGNDYPLELHLVHYSCDYYTLTDAVTDYHSGALEDSDDNNVLGVVAIFFEIGEPNIALEQILNDMIWDGIHTYRQQTYDHFLSFYYTQFNLNDLLPTNREFIGYKGSLTTPPCYETVRWQVMKEKMTVSLEQMLKFRMVLESTDLTDSMAPNWRPLQNINDREMYECEDSVIAVDKSPINDHNSEGGEHGHSHESGEHTLHMEIGGSNEKWLWVAIGVLLLVTFYLCYVVNFSSKGEGDHKVASDTGNGELEVGTEEEESAIFNDSMAEV